MNIRLLYFLPNRNSFMENSKSGAGCQPEMDSGLPSGYLAGSGETKSTCLIIMRAAGKLLQVLVTTSMAIKRPTVAAIQKANLTLRNGIRLQAFSTTIR